MRAKSGICITILPDHVDVPVSQLDQSVLEVALRMGIPLDHACGGSGTCGTCLVHIVKGPGNLEQRNQLESEMAMDRGFRDEERLACQMKPINGLVLCKD